MTDEKTKRSKQSLATAAKTQQRYRKRQKEQGDFDKDRVKRQLINPNEVAPFVPCVTGEEEFDTARKFAHAYRRSGKDVPDIQPGETMSQFSQRVHDMWWSGCSDREYSKFLNLRTLRFDAEYGYHSSDPADAVDVFAPGGWKDLPGSGETVDATSLHSLGPEPIPEWKEQGFEDWAEYHAWQLSAAAEKRTREEVLKSVLEQQEDMKRKPPTPKRVFGTFSSQIGDV